MNYEFRTSLVDEVGGYGGLADLAGAGFVEADANADAADGLGVGGGGFALADVVHAVFYVVIDAVRLLVVACTARLVHAVALIAQGPSVVGHALGIGSSSRRSSQSKIGFVCILRR